MALSDIPTNIGPDHTFVCVGHGALYQRTDAGDLSFTVPDNIWVVFWVMHGETVAGKAIEEYRTEIRKVDARYRRGTEPGPDGFSPRADAPKRMGGRLGADTLQGLRQAIATAGASDVDGAAGAAAASAAGLSDATSGVVARGARAQESRRRDRAHDAGLFAAMKLEMDTGRGIDSTAVEEDRRALPSVPAFFFADHRLPSTAPVAERGRRLETILNFIAGRHVTPAIVHWAACRGIFPAR